MSYAQVMTEDRRLVILRALDGSPERKANHFVLTTICGQMGHSVAHDVTLGDLAWLDDMGLCTREVVHSAGGSITIAAITVRGADVAAGRVQVPGVKRPLPGE